MYLFESEPKVYIVAESYAEAEKLFILHFTIRPNSLKKLDGDLIVQKQEDKDE
jgi:hypothetical protein